MADRLRDLIDLVLASLDEPATGGAELARRASFSRDHLDRILTAATGETPVALRRRLLLERAAWQLRDGASASAAADGAGYGSLAAFSRAFARAHGVPPSAFPSSGRPTTIEAPNGVHFLPPAGLLVPRRGRGDVVSGRGAAPRTVTSSGNAAPDRSSSSRPDRPLPSGSGAGSSAVRRLAASAPRDLTERMVLHHLARTRELLEAAATLPVAALARPLRPARRLVWFEGPEPDAATMAERLVATLEVWVAAVLGETPPEAGPTAIGRPEPPHPSPGLLARLDRAGPAFAGIARRIRDGEAWDDAFVDALCEPPQAFTYGGVLSHVLTYGAIRREALAATLVELGATVASSGDPIEWEAGR